MQGKPVSLTFDRFKQLIESNKLDKASNVRVLQDFTIIVNMDYLIQAVLRFDSIFQLQDYRFGYVSAGQAHAHINLIDKQLTPGMIVFITPGTIVQPIEVTQDFKLTGMTCSPDFMHIVMNDALSSTFNQTMKDAQKILTANESDLIRQMFSLLLQTVSQQVNNQQVIKSIIRTIILQYDYHFSAVKTNIIEQHSNERNIFERFIYLVNKNCKQEHQMGFYAEKMCLTDRYLGTVVKAVSGQTGKEWIDRALITSAKVLLKHSDKTIIEIADELNFPTVSFFCKYFKRLTSTTPNQFRQTYP